MQPLFHRAIDASYVDPDTMDFEGQDFVLPADPQPKPEKVSGFRFYLGGGGEEGSIKMGRMGGLPSGRGTYMLCIIA
jgi:hypothetical protein